MNVLIVDDDRISVATLRQTLEQLGHIAFHACSAEEALVVLRRDEIRLVITNRDLPGMSGIDLCKTLRSDEFKAYIYIVILSERDNSESRRIGLLAGADDFLYKPIDQNDLMVCCKTAERILALETRDLALFALAQLAESRDPDTGVHVERVQNYSRILAQHLTPEVKARHGINADFIRLLHQTSALHDLGKVAIPDSILLKPGRLTHDEFEVMKTHTILGAQTLDAALQRFPTASYLRMARDIAASHHERFDGLGYPSALRGDQIPFCARMVALADVYDALTSRRVYKEAMPHHQAKEIILSGRGGAFDPNVVDAFVQSEQQFADVWNKLRADPLPRSPQSAPVHHTPDDGVFTILVVEDEETMAAEVVKLLSSSDNRVLAATNIQDAMHLFMAHRPEIVVSDWELSGGSGLQFCEQIRAHESGTPTYFVMLTVHSEKDMLLRAYAAGVNDFVTKPFHQDELLARIRAGLRVSELHRELARKRDRLLEANSQLKAINLRLDHASITDDLTGLFNRRHAMARLEELWSSSTRYGTRFTVAGVDIDHFKAVNDKHGHEGGDIILRQIAAILRDSTRGTDVVCRIGGEEFLILLPAQHLNDAVICLERCRRNVARHIFNAGGEELRMTVSVGIAMSGPEFQDIPDLLLAVDDTLYRAKRSGRNCVLLKQANSSTGESETEMPSQALPAPDGAIDFNAIAERCGADAEFVAGLTKRFSEHAPAEVQRLSDALASNDRDAFRRAAHTMRSMSAYVTADHAAELCRQLEELACSDRLSETAAIVQSLQSEIHQIADWITHHADLATAST